MLASGDNAGVVTIWDAATGAPLLTLDALAAPAVALVWSADNQRLAAATGAQVDDDEAAIILWDVESGAPQASFASDGTTLTSLAWSPDETGLIAGTLAGEVLAWELP